MSRMGMPSSVTGAEAQPAARARSATRTRARSGAECRIGSSPGELRRSGAASTAAPPAPGRFRLLAERVEQVAERLPLLAVELGELLLLDGRVVGGAGVDLD